MNGKIRRLGRILRGPEKRCLCVPMDHGLWIGAVEGIVNPRQITREVLAGGATSVLLNPGFYCEVSDLIEPHIGLIIRVSATTTLSPKVHQEVLFVGVEKAITLDADAVAVTINVGAEGDLDTLAVVGKLIDDCERWGMPVLAEMLPAKDPYDAVQIAHSARIAFEMGAAIVKTNYSGNPDSFRTVIEAAPIPVVIAGGPKVESEELILEIVRGAIAAGAAGVAIGRNVWQCRQPRAMLHRMRKEIFG